MKRRLSELLQRQAALRLWRRVPVAVLPRVHRASQCSRPAGARCMWVKPAELLSSLTREILRFGIQVGVVDYCSVVP
jgi:hypothetical protein